MSEPSDFPDSFDPNDPFSSPQPFDPIEHFEPLAEGHPEPMFEGLIDETGEEAHHDLGEIHEHEPVHVHHTGDEVAISDEGNATDWSEFAQKYQQKHEHDTPPFKAPVLRSIVTAFGLGGLFMGAGYLFAQVSGIQPAPPAAPPTAAATPAAPVPAAADEVKALAGRVDGLKGDFDGLGKRIDDLQKAIAAMPKPEPAPNLKPIQAQLESLGKKVESVPTVDTKALEAKLADIKTEGDSTAEMTKGLGSKLAALEAKVKGLGETKPAATAMAAPATTAAATPATASSDADFAKAVDLVKQGQFAAAKDSFTKLTTATPTDARAWYYAAITTGYVTTDWTKDAVKFVTKGVELEKAGTPEVAKINAAFADLPASTKAWLDYYRAQAK